MGAVSDHAPATRYVVGCMTGTSLDGLDAALVRIDGTGLDMTAAFVGMVSAPLPEALRGVLLSMANGQAHPPLDYLRAARHLGAVHAEAVAALLDQHGQGLDIDFVVAHGQTIWHAPADRLSWQLFDPWPIVRALRLPVCYDLRQADLVAGGEGAPVTPIADWVMYRAHTDAVLNLGGICNATWLSDRPESVRGQDLLPCNILLDGLCQRLFGAAYDRGGGFASKGQRSTAVGGVLAEQIEHAARGARSLGREHFDAAWLDRLASETKALAGPNEVLRTAVEFVGASIAEFLSVNKIRRAVLAGGGVKNTVLVDSIQKIASNREILVSDEMGTPAEAREATGFAVLGVLSADGVSVTLPGVTGADAPGVAGAWAYPQGPPATPSR